MTRLTEAEKFQRKADRINAKRAAEMPLFADQDKTDGDAEYWRWRYNKAQADGTITPSADGVFRYNATRLLLVLQEMTLRELARRHLPGEAFTGLWEYRQRTYPLPGPEYGVPFWERILTGTKRVVFAWKKVGEKQSQYGVYPVLEENGVWPPPGWTPPFTADQLEEMFAWREEPPGPAPDGGLSEYVDLILLRNYRGQHETNGR